MNRFVNGVLLFAAIMFMATSAFAVGNYANNDMADGSVENPFEIATAAQLDELGLHSEDWSLCFYLSVDIDLADFNGLDGNPVFNRIGTGSGGDAFDGIFDGNGHTVSNLTLTFDGIDYIGLFGYLGSNAVIENLGVEDVNIDAINGLNIGALAGYNSYGTISNCYTTGTVIGSQYVGGLVGHNYYGNVDNCYSRVSVTGPDNCSFLGGLTGRSYRGSISKCYSTGYVSGGTGSSLLGGLIGYRYQTAITACFWDIDTSSQADSAGGTGKPTADMKDMTIFTDPAAGWDFLGESINGDENNWGEPVNANDGYPVLSWQDVPICVNRPKYDSNGDCRVNFVDFTDFVSQWLTCGLLDPNDCPQ